MRGKDHIMLIILTLLGLVMTSRLWAKIRARLLQQRLPTGLEGDQLLLWGGLFLSALGIGLLALYLILQP